MPSCGASACCATRQHTSDRERKTALRISFNYEETQISGVLRGFNKTRRRRRRGGAPGRRSSSNMEVRRRCAIQVVNGTPGVKPKWLRAANGVLTPAAIATLDAQNGDCWRVLLFSRRHFLAGEHAVLPVCQTVEHLKFTNWQLRCTLLWQLRVGRIDRNQTVTGETFSHTTTN